MEKVILFIYRHRRFIFPAFLLLGAAGLGWWTMSERHPKPQWRFFADYGIRLPVDYTIHGIDVSHHNRRIDWQKVRNMEADGVTLQFVFMKATEGATLVDRQFRTNWRGAHTVGLKRGAYHFYLPRRDPQKQAQNFIRTVTLAPGDFAPVLDFEKTSGLPADKLLDDLRIWLTAIEAHYHVKPIIYTNGHLYSEYIAGNFDDYPLWIADYSREHLRTYNARKLYFWQHNKSGWVRGIRGQVDFNVFLMEPEQMDDICL